MANHLIEHGIATDARGNAAAAADCALTSWHSLSAGQLALWFQYRLHAESQAAHNRSLVFCVRARGRLDSARLAAALRSLIARHPMLAAEFAEADGEPMQRIRLDAEPGLLRVDARNFSAQQLTDAVQEDLRRPFDLQAPPLLRASVYDIDQDEAVLLLAFDHIVCDGWSFWLVLEELGEVLVASASEAPATQPRESSIQYFDYIAAQQQALAGAMGERQWDFWRRQLDNLPLLELPLDRPRGAAVAYRGAEVPFTLEPALTAQVKHLATATAGSVYSTLLTAFQILLHRYTGQDEVVIGTVLPARGDGTWDEVVGHFANPVVLRADLSEGPPARKALRCARDTALMALKNQDFPFSTLVQRSGIARDPTRHPMFQATFVMQRPRHGHDLAALWSDEKLTSIVRWGGLNLTGFPLPPGAARFDLTFEVMDAGDRMRGWFKFNADLLDSATVERMVGHLKTLLAGLIEQPEASIDHLPLMAPAEREQVLVGFNDSRADFPQNLCVHELFEQQAARTPDAMAVVCEERSLTCAELNARANQLAHRLRSLGVGPDVLVAICVERSTEMVVGLLATLKAGGAYVPIDPDFPPNRIAFMLEDAAPKVVLTRKSLDAALPATAAPRVWFDEADTALVAQRADNLVPRRIGLTPNHLAYVIYTSGSTGQPKGVMVEHRQLTNYIRSVIERLELSGEMSFASVSTFAADLGYTVVYPALCMGGLLHIISQETAADPSALAGYFERHQIDCLKIVPSHLSALLTGERPDLVLPRRRLLLGGEASSWELIERVRELAPDCVIFNHYGPTETTVGVLTNRLEPADAASRLAAPPLGRPIHNTRVYVLDANRQLVPAGVPGELYVGGAAPSRGYLNRPELTAERFIADPFSQEPQARLYRTGDRARLLPDGCVQFLGRVDHQVKIRGFRIELGEIESVLAQHPSVRDAVVLAREDTPGDKRLAAYVVAHEGESLEVGALRDHLRAVVPEYMIPAHFVVLDKLRLTVNGKVDRKALPAPDMSALAQAEYEPPQGELEVAMAAIWSELLGVARVGRQDDFFALGGHSLLVPRMLDRLRRAGWQITARDVFVAPVLHALAALARIPEDEFMVPVNLIPDACTALEPGMLPLVSLTQQEIDLVVSEVSGGAANVQDIYPLTALQEGILYHHVASERGDPYIVSNVLRLESRERLDQVLGALQQVIDRHDLLRSSVHWEGMSAPVQAVWRRAVLPVQELQLSVEGGAAEQLMARIDPRTMRMSLRRAPLMAAYTAADPHSQGWLLSLLMHHVALDHVAQKIMLEEIVALLRGNELPAPVPFRGFVAQTLAQARSGDSEVFFRELLGDVDESTAPFGLMDSQLDGVGLREAAGELTAQLARRLRQAARGSGVSVAALFHVAWAMVVGRCAGRDDVVFGTVLSGRQGTADADRAFGLFINTLPVRVSVAGAGAHEAVLRTHRLLAELLRHEQSPLAQVQRLSGVRAPLPLFTALLNYRQPSDAPADGLAGIELLHSEERVNYPFTLSTDDLGEGFALKAQTAPGIDPQRVIGFMQTALAELVGALESAPQTLLCALNVLTPSEREQVLVGFNDTVADFPQKLCVHQLYEQQAARSPNAVAVVFEERSLTYAELNSRANQLAHHLRGLGVGPDVLVAICVERSIEMVVGLLAILKAGGAYVPIDPDYPPDRIEFMLQDCASKVVLTQSSLAETLPASGAIVVQLDADAQAWQDQPQTAPAPRAAASDLAYVIYTSGSTGKPKGVMVTHGNVTRLFAATKDWYGFGAQDVWSVFHSFAFDFSVWELWGALIYGGRAVIVPRLVSRSPREFRALLADSRVTVLNQTPSAFRALLAADEDLHTEAGVQGQSLPPLSLRHVIFGGEALDPRSLAPWFERYGDTSPQLVNMYGITETTVHVTYRPLTQADAASATSAIGSAIPDLRLYLLDAHRQPVPIGVIGELYVGGAGLARGYLNRPELTAERFLTDSFSAEPGARMYKTGDLGRWRDNGELEYLGRSDHQVKIRGFRIELGEIESVLAQHPEVREAVVVAREDTPGDKRLVAYLVAREAPLPGVSELRSHLQGKLPEYMVPSVFVNLDALPLTPNGKLDRKALPAPELFGGSQEHTYVAPRTPAEEKLAGIWSELLHIDRVGVHDNFYALGGHSLSVVQMADQVRRHFGIELPLSAIFQLTTLEDLANVLTTQHAAPLRSLTPIARQGHGTALFLVHPGGGNLTGFADLARTVDSGGPIYGLQSVGLDGKEAPLRSIEEMAEHYLNEIREVQPHGPYFLLGWSFGGLVAYEMAHRLRTARESVGFLGMLDSWAAFPLSSLPSDDFGLLAFFFRGVIRFDVPLLRSMPREAALRIVLKEFEKIGMLPAGTPLEMAEPLMNVLKTNIDAMRVYRPPHYDGDVTLFVATEGASVEISDGSLGWANRVGGELSIYPVKARHHDMVFQPHVKPIAAILRKVLSRSAPVDALNELLEPLAVAR